MSYQEMSDLYTSLAHRGRFAISVREQGQIFSADGREDIAALGKGVVAGNPADIDAVIAAICVGPSWAEIAEDDVALTGAVQECWPRVADALYGNAAAG